MIGPCGCLAARWLPGTIACGAVAAVWLPAAASAAPPTFAGPAFGTTYRVTLARSVPGSSVGEIHREVERLLARIDRSLSTWREDSDASRFNRAAPGDWVDVAPDLVTVVETARRVHEASGGAFDVTAAARHPARPTGMRLVESRTAPPALRKSAAGVALDLGGIGPGHAVDAIGERLVALGSSDHLVELGGEVRAWGRHPDGGRWRVRLRVTASAAAGDGPVELEPGEALATSTLRPGRSPLDPRTGLVVAPTRASATVRATSCAVADAWAVAALVLDSAPDADGTIRVP